MNMVHGAVMLRDGSNRCPLPCCEQLGAPSHTYFKIDSERTQSDSNLHVHTLRGYSYNVNSMYGAQCVLSESSLSLWGHQSWSITQSESFVTNCRLCTLA